MKLFSASELRAWDNYTCQDQNITSLALMERAATSCAAYTRALFLAEAHTWTDICIVCGTGNNGGDGLVMARKLALEQLPVHVCIVKTGSSPSPDFEINLNRLKQETSIRIEYLDETTFPDINVNTLVIDCIFGTGLNKAVQGWIASIIKYINRNKGYTLSIDVPSGLPVEIPESSLGDFTIIKADRTLTFQQPKLSFLFAETYQYTGETTVVDIGLSDSFNDKTPGTYFYITEDLIRSLITPRLKFSHKGTFGHALIVAGSYGKMGAAILAATSALRTGCGLVTAYIPKAGYQVMQTAIPEVMVQTDDGAAYFERFPETQQYSAVGVGPGLGMRSETMDAFANWISGIRVPLVLDADALNIIAEKRDQNAPITFPANTIITPHPKEFDRLAGASSTSYERLNKQRTFAAENNCIVVLKGAYTSIALPDGRVFFNSTGNVLLSTAGSGDVLTGMITSLLAQGYGAQDAATLGVYIHGACADSKLNKGVATMLASEITAEIPGVLYTLASPV